MVGNLCGFGMIRLRPDYFAVCLPCTRRISLSFCEPISQVDSGDSMSFLLNREKRMAETGRKSQLEECYAKGA
jgi:hypothetical protein